MSQRLGVLLCLLLALLSCAQAQEQRRFDPLPAAKFKASSRIIGGNEIPVGKAPYMVSIQNYFGNHICGGAIIHDQYILTAASCMGGLRKRDMKVVMSTNDWAGPAWQYKVEEIIMHCKFDQPLYHNDIALLKLETLVAYDDVTQNITLAALNTLKEGEKLTLTGWGIEEDDGDYVYNLKQLQLAYVNNAHCNATYQGTESLDVGHLCAVGKQGTGACMGDQGGPLINEAGELVGIVNFGVPCARGFPDVFARVSFYYDWILATINGCAIE
ncbi:CG31267 [Drosophila busckii]|uniref:CG31267 n=1 Tax=Drosophila busckii TaxID=30019 RepID=A0A0M4EEM9_DROBS|nr:chymotrypsin-2 [Drosophila busckii]ALC46478.1 CG31267 [Drosophila busckii]